MLGLLACQPTMRARLLAGLLPRQELAKLPDFVVEGAKVVLQEMQAMEKEAQRVIRGSGGTEAPALAVATELVPRSVQSPAVLCF